MDPNANVGADVPSDVAVPPPPFGGGGVSSPPIPSGPAVFSLPPIVLRVLPLQQSSAPVGFIYDASPDPVDGGLVAAASAFFSHQGHKVFHDPCPDLEAYCRSMGVPPSTVVNIDRLPDYLLTSGLEILASWAAPLLTNAALAGTAFMATYLSPSSSGVGTSRPLGPSSSSARPMGGLSSLSARTSAPPPVSVLGRFGVPGAPRGDQVHGGPPLLGSGVLADPHGSSPPHPRPSTSTFIGGSFATFRTPIRNPYVGSSRSLHTDPGGFCGGSRPPPPVTTPPASGPAPARRPDPDEDVPLPPPSGHGSFPSLVSFGGFRSVSSVGRYHGGRSSSSSSGSRGGLSSSVPSLGRPACSPASAYDGSGDLSKVDHLSVSTSRASFHGGSPPVRVSSPDVPLVPIPVPTDRFTLPPIKSADDYLQTRDILLFWLRSPGFSTACSDAILMTDTRNALASQFWEGQLQAAIKDGPACFLFENTGTTFYGKGFEMLQVLEDHFRPSTISNSFTTLLSLFNDTQGDKESIHEFWSRFEGHMGALSHSSVAIPPILQVMLFLRGMHSRYQDILSQFASKHKDLAVATIDSIVCDAKFMDEFKLVEGSSKPRGSPTRVPSVAAVTTDQDGKEFRNPFEWLATYDSGFVKQRWQRSLRGGFYCAFCSGKEKHHPLKCPLLGDLGLKIIQVGGGKDGGSSSGSGGLGAGPLGGTTPLSSTPPAAAPAAVCPPPAAPASGSASAPAGLTLSRMRSVTRILRTTFVGMGMTMGMTINLMGSFLLISRHVLESRPSPSLLWLPPLGLSSVEFHRTLWLWVTTSFSLRNWSPLSSGLSPPLIRIASSLRTRVQLIICSPTVRLSSLTSRFALFRFGWATTLMLPSSGGARPLSP